MTVVKIREIVAYTRQSLLERKIPDTVPNRLQFLLMLTDRWETDPEFEPFPKRLYGGAVGLEIMALADEIERTSVSV